MIRHLLHVDFDPRRGLQEQVRETLINAILGGIFSADTPLPSCRQLASQLRVSRNTTALVFEGLVNEGYLVSRPRSGYYLHPDYQHASPSSAPEAAPQDEGSAPRWGTRLQITPSQQESILKPAGWIPASSRWRAGARRQTGCTAGCATRSGWWITSIATCRC